MSEEIFYMCEDCEGIVFKLKEDSNDKNKFYPVCKSCKNILVKTPVVIEE